jgi:hypothetical protein
MEERIAKRIHRLAHVETYEVTADELTAIEQGYSSRQNDLTFLSIFIGTFVSFLTVVLSTTFPEAPTIREFSYIAALIFSGGASLIFGLRWFWSGRQEKPIFERIRARAVGPLGEQGREIQLTDLDK